MPLHSPLLSCFSPPPRNPMGCFLGCFGGAKERRCRRKRSPAQSPNGRARTAPRASPKKVDLDGEAVSATAPLLGKLLELRDSSDDLYLAVVKKKKVMFDPNVTTYEPAAIPEHDSEGGDPDEDEKSREEDWMLAPDCAKSEAFPLNHRYGSCADSEYDEEEEEEDDDDEYEDCYEQEDGLDECAVDDEGEEHGLLGVARGEEEGCESLFLLPISKTTKESNGQETTASGVTAPELSVANAVRDRSEQAARHALSSVENLTQWKEPKSRAAPAPKSTDKENVILAEPAITTKKKEARPAVSDFSYSPSTPSKQEPSVDASLSTWLGSSGTPQSNSVRSYSPISREDRPILGALTVEDIKISSANSSPRRSRSTSPSPDDVPILGTVGAYWNCSAKGGNAVTRGGFMKTRTRFGQDDAVNCY